MNQCWPDSRKNICSIRGRWVKLIFVTAKCGRGQNGWNFAKGIGYFPWVFHILIEFHWYLFLRIKLTIYHHHCTSITWTNEDIFQWCICRSSGHDEFFHSLKGAAEWPTILAPQRNWRTLDTHEDDFPLDSYLNYWPLVIRSWPVVGVLCLAIFTCL